MKSPVPKWIALSLVLAAAVPGHALGGFGVTNIPPGPFSAWASEPGVTILTGDFSGDGLADIALVGGAGWHSIPLAFSNGDGTFDVRNLAIGPFGTWATAPNVKAFAGDYNGDGRTDVLLTGNPGWASVPVAFSNGDGTFQVTNLASDFAFWTSNVAAQIQIGDYNSDGKTDLAITGPIGAPVVPVAISNGDGTFAFTAATSSFAVYGYAGNPKTLVGDFNGDGRSDLALTGASGWGTLPVAFSNGDGTFGVTNFAVPDFPTYAAQPGARLFVGQFDDDDKADIGVTGVAGWVTVPLALSNGNGSFDVVNNPNPDFAGPASAAGARLLVGDFNADRKTDLALTGPSSWSTLPVSFSRGDGSFLTTNLPIVAFASWSLAATVLVADFDGDARADVALTGVPGWTSLPIAFSLSRHLP